MTWFSVPIWSSLPQRPQFESFFDGFSDRASADLDVHTHLLLSIVRAICCNAEIKPAHDVTLASSSVVFVDRAIAPCTSNGIAAVRSIKGFLRRGDA